MVGAAVAHSVAVSHGLISRSGVFRFESLDFLSLFLLCVLASVELWPAPLEMVVVAVAH